MTLTQPGVPSVTHEAELVSATGHLFRGDRTYKFKGPFPVDAVPFRYPPLPEPPTTFGHVSRRTSPGRNVSL